MAMRSEPFILYEDADMLAVYKPAGLVVHSDGKILRQAQGGLLRPGSGQAHRQAQGGLLREYTLVDWLLENFPEMKNVGEQWNDEKGQIIFRSGIVHRLDRETSGVLLVAKTQSAFEYLKQQFKDRKIKKTYRAFVYGKVKDDTGIIDKPIGRSKNDFRKWSAEYGARGDKREAVTEFKVLARGENFSYLELYPKTGRTHQIRVHLKAIGHPVVGDKLYAPKGEALLGFERTALHAFSIEFMAPSGKPLHIEAPLPEDFEKAVKVA